MTYKKVILPQLLESIAKEIGLNPGEISNGTIVNNTKNTNRNKYNSSQFYQNRQQKIERCIDLKDKGYLVIRSANPNSLIHYVTLHQKIDSQKKIEDLAVLDSELLSITNACCTIVRYKDKEYFEKDIEDFSFEIKIDWTYYKGQLHRNDTQINIDTIYQSRKKDTKYDASANITDFVPLIHEVSQGSIKKGTMLNHSFFWRPFYYDEIYLKNSNKVTIIKSKNDIKLDSESFNYLNEKANGLTTVEEAILSGREKEFISIFEMRVF